MLSQFLCAIGWHFWTDWEYHIYATGHYDKEEWWQRTCKVCGKTEERDLDFGIEKD